MKTYRNIQIDGDKVSGEYQEQGSKSWNLFSGCLPLMRISAVIDSQPRSLRQFMALADGYGERGLFPSGYDWSGIRDSSPEALREMDELAKWLNGNKGWGWEAKPGQDEVSALLGSQPGRVLDAKNNLLALEWRIAEKYSEQLAPALASELERLGCSLINVDSSRAPYYWVQVRLES